MARDRVSVTTQREKTGFNWFRAPRDKAVDEWNEKPPYFFFPPYCLLFFRILFFARECEDRNVKIFFHVYTRGTSKNSRLSRAHAFHQLFVFSIRSSVYSTSSFLADVCMYVCMYAWESSPPPYLNSAKRVILHGTNVSWISSNASTLLPSSC